MKKLVKLMVHKTIKLEPSNEIEDDIKDIGK